MNPSRPFKSGYTSIIGRPNVGKSTLLNRLVAQKVAATSNRPQTTRNKITGVVHLSGAQIILVDTPGIHPTKKTLNEMMVQASLSTYSDVDLILVLIDALEGFVAEDEFVLKSMEQAKAPKNRIAGCICIRAIHSHQDSSRRPLATAVTKRAALLGRTESISKAPASQLCATRRRHRS